MEAESDDQFFSNVPDEILNFCNNPDTQPVQEGVNGTSNTLYVPLTDYPSITEGNNLERPSTSQEDIASESSQIISSESTQSIYSEFTISDNSMEAESDDQFFSNFPDEILNFCNNTDNQPVQEGVNGTSNTLYVPLTDYPSITEGNNLERPSTSQEDIVSESSLSFNSTEDGSTEEYTNTFTDKNFNNCLEGKSQPCFICNNDAGPNGDRRLLKCCKEFCGKYYHYYCIKNWPIMKSMSYTFIRNNPPQLEVLICPRHFCRKCEHCLSEYKEITSGKIVTCVKCPVAYHYGNKCIPAGSEIISRREIICPAHFVMTVNLHRNTTWCIICLSDEPTLFCKTCPVSFHHDCIPGAPHGCREITCLNCEQIIYPNYGDFVWINRADNMIWPAKIIHPFNVPKEISDMAHEKGEFVVKCILTNDYHWKNHGCSFNMKGYANFTMRIFENMDIDTNLRNAIYYAGSEISIANSKKIKRGVKINRVDGTGTWLQFQPL